MEELFYWVIEYVKVLVGYGFIMFVWPLTVFRKFLNGKDATLKFSFCVTVQVVIINTVVLMLGLLHILNDWTMRIFFYGIFLYSIREHLALTVERKNKFKYLVNGSFGFKNFLRLEIRKYVRICEEFFKRVFGFYKKNWLEYTLVVIAVIYGTIYFSWGVFHDRSYGFSDIYVHHSWIYQLAQGKPFSAGIYPEGMHCFIYALNALFNIRIYSCLLFVASPTAAVILISAYCLMKELFQWRYSAVFSLVVFLIFGGIGSTIILCVSRVQCALPQEFGFYAIFLCALYLLKYLKSSNQAKFRGKVTKGYWDENLLVFMLAFIATIVIHFYDTFMAFYVCLGVAIYLWKKIFTKERFLPLVAAVAVGGVIAAAPMVLGFVSGISLQGSLGWAMEVMTGSGDDGGNAQTIPQQGSIVNDVPTGNQSGTMEEVVQNMSQDASQIAGESVETDAEDVSIYVTLKNKVTELWKKILTKGKNLWEKGKVIWRKLYTTAYRILYREETAQFTYYSLPITFFFCIFLVIFKVVLKKVCHVYRVDSFDVSGYFMILIASFVYILAFSSTQIGLPMFVDRARIGFVSHLLTVMVFIIPIDVLMCFIRIMLHKKAVEILSYVVTAGLVVGVFATGNYHGYGYFALTRYDATVQITNKIIDSLPKNTYTIVSPTEELYQVIEHGRHEELTTFLKNQNKDTYTIPTEYVFIFVEKKALRYVQMHCFDGPLWVAGSKYADEMYNTYSQWPEYLGVDISSEAAQKELMVFSKPSNAYSNQDSRVIVESKMYEWCQKFKEAYPNELKTFYEDEYFVCYYFQQNTQRLYNLVME